MLEQTDDRLSFNVTRCRYAEMYRALGLDELGGSLSCCRDFALVEGFNPEIELERTQTLMEGATHCDFRFRTKPDPGRALILIPTLCVGMRLRPLCGHPQVERDAADPPLRSETGSSTLPAPSRCPSRP